ncbi:MAG: HD domain-containing protein, partial [Rubripirellula sp.]
MSHCGDPSAVSVSVSQIPSCDIAVDAEVDQLSEALAMKFEELTLIHQLSEKLKLEEDPGILCDSLLSQLSPCVSASALVIDLHCDEDHGIEAQHYMVGQDYGIDHVRAIAREAYESRGSLNYNAIVDNRVVLDPLQLDDDRIDGQSAGSIETLPSSLTHRVVVVPIQQQSQVLGNMIAIRASHDDEFGTVEADLMKSTSMLMGVHLVNQRQYYAMQQMFEGMIGSLASALDAKDTYTSGHSTRVADLSVELAKRLEFDESGIRRIRMAGILHDIGKIGVKDSV